MCELRVTSKSSSFKAFLEKSKAPVYQSHEKGDLPEVGLKSPYEDYGFSCDVSEGEWDDLSGQFEDAFNFLKKYEPEIQDLIQQYSIDDIRLDFPYECRLDEQIFMQSDYLPPNLLYIAGKLGIGIELSHYAVSEDHDSEQIISADG